jgi:hypothetical protein
MTRPGVTGPAGFFVWLTDDKERDKDGNKGRRGGSLVASVVAIFVESNMPSLQPVVSGLQLLMRSDRGRGTRTTISPSNGVDHE